VPVLANWAPATGHVILKFTSWAVTLALLDPHGVVNTLIAFFSTGAFEASVLARSALTSPEVVVITSAAIVSLKTALRISHLTHLRGGN